MEWAAAGVEDGAVVARADEEAAAGARAEDVEEAGDDGVLAELVEAFHGVWMGKSNQRAANWKVTVALLKQKWQAMGAQREPVRS